MQHVGRVLPGLVLFLLGLFLVGARLAGLAWAAPVPRVVPDAFASGYLGVSMSLDDSLVISDVRPGYPAQKSGLLPGDALVQVGPIKPQQFSEVGDFIYHCRPGTVLRVIVRRNGQPVIVTVTLDEIPADLRETIQNNRRNRDEPLK